MTENNSMDPIKRHYATDENLRIRQETHDNYTIPQRNFVEWSLNCVDWRGDEQVLDIGAGPGNYYLKLKELQPTVSYYGIDLIPAMIQNHPDQNGLSIADASTLPYPSNTFDVVMANHMLYHVPDVDGVLSEVKRILKPNGIFIATTNSVQTMPELQVLMRRAIVLLTKQGATQVRAPSLPSDSFALENGTRLLAKHFFSVIRYDMPSALVFPQVEPAMRYLESTRDLRDKQLPDDVVWEDVMMIMRQQINQLIKHLGELAISKQSGLLLASNTGGPIAEFLEHRDRVDGQAS